MWRWADVREDVREMWEKMWRWADVKMRRCERRCEDEQMWRWADVKMSRCERRCEDEQMWRCEKMWRWADVKMSRCEDEQMWRWTDVTMRRCEDEKMRYRCEDEKMWRWEDKIQTPTIGRTLRSDALGKNISWMLALVTCHIFPPSIWYGKKWIPGTWLPGWQLAVFQSTASRVRSGRCPRQCATLLHGQLYLQEKNACFAIWPHVGTKFFNSSHHFLSMDGWPGDATFFLWGQPLKIIPQVFSQKKEQPLGFYFWHVRLGLLKSPFFGWWSWTYVAVPFCKDKCIFSKTHMFCNLGARWPQNSWIRPIMSYLWMIGLVMRLFSCGANLWRSSASIESKKVQPLEFYFWHVRLGLLKSPFLVGEAEHMWLYPFCKDKCIFSKKTSVLQFGRVDTKFLNSSHHVLSVDDWPGDAIFFLWANHWRLSRKYSVKKGPAPWILFLTRAPRPLEVTFFGWWSWTYVVVPLLQGQMYFQQKKRLFCNLGALTQNSWIRPIMSYLWMIGLEMRFFSCGPTIEDYPASIQSEKGAAPWILFLTPAPRPLQVTFLVGEAEHVCLYPFARTTVFSAKKTCVLQFGRALTQNSWIRPIMSYQWMIGLVMRLFSCGANLWRSSASIQSKKVQPLGFYFWPLRLGLLKSLFWLVKVNICVCTLLQSHVKNHTPSINHGTFFSWGLTFRYVLVNSHLIHPPSNSWLLTLGILQTYPLSESFMIDFLMPYNIHRLIDQPPLNHNRQKLISCHCTSGSFQEKNLGLFWYDILFLAPYHAPGPSPTVC